MADLNQDCSHGGRMEVSVTTVHVVLQPTGSIGKSAAATCLAQWYNSKGVDVLCIDFDPLQQQFLGLESIQAHRIRFPSDLISRATLLSEPFQAPQFGELLSLLVADNRPVVVDTGAVCFLPLLNFLSDGRTSERFRSAGKKLLVHQVVGGQPDNQLKAIRGLEWTADHSPSELEFVVWLNEFYFPVFRDQESWKATTVYQKHGERIKCLVRLPFDLGGVCRAAVERMISLRLSYDAALQNAELSAQEHVFLGQAYESILRQLDSVLERERECQGEATFPAYDGADKDEIPQENPISKVRRLGLTFDEAMESSQFTLEERAFIGGMLLRINGQLGLFFDPGVSS